MKPARNLTLVQPEPVDIAAQSKFWASVNRQGPDECWLWVGYRNEKGYGIFHWDCQRPRATNVMLDLDGRPRPSEKHVACHRCDNPPCVNPAHLWWGTRADNTRDMYKKRRHPLQTAERCKYGHLYTPENLIPCYLKHGLRRCRICWNRQQTGIQRRRRANRREAANGQQA